MLKDPARTAITDRKVRIRCALDPSQVQDDSSMRGEFN